MGDQTTESVIFELRINSEQYKSEQKLIRDSLGQIALDLEKTRAAQKALNDERKAGKISDEQYAAQSVKLREQLKGQMADQRELEKGLATSQKAYNASAGSAEQLRAQLAELKTAYYAMSEAERQSAEGQAIQKQALAISDSLSLIEKSVGTASRDVGKYGEGFKQGLAGVVAELVKAKAAQQGFAEGSEEAARNQIKVNGFQTAAQRAAAQAGITDFTQAKATIDQYTQAFTPAVENLMQLQREQQQAGQTVSENSEQYQQLGFRVAGAQKALDDLVAAQVAGEKAAQGGAQAAGQQAQATTLAAGSLGALRQQLLDLLNTRETLDPTTKEAEELNTQILELRTNIQQAEGKIDEFGERVQKNIKKENFDTVTDAVQGMVGAFSVATLVLGDNSDAAAAQAKALQLMTIAQNARAIAIGLDSAKDAAQIVLLKAKSLFLREEATLTAAAAVSTEAHAAVAGADAAAIEAQAGAAALNAEGQVASAEATTASTVATEAQVVVTESATIAQRALNLAMRLNPIGLVIIAVAALVSLFAVYRNASEQTRQKIRDVTEAFLRFGTPIGLVYTGIEKLYQKFALVRTVLDPLIGAFNKVAGEVAKDARAAGEWAGILDTAAEKSAKLAEQQVALGESITARIEAEARAMELAGATEDQVRAKQRTGLTKRLDDLYDFATKQDALDQKELDRIAKKQQAQELLSDKEKDFLQKSAERRQQARDAENALDAFDLDSIERKRVARQQEAADIQTNAQRAAQNLQRRIEQQDAAENAALQRNISRIALRLSSVQKGTVEELRLQQQQVQAQAALDIKRTQDELAERTRLRAAYYPQELAALNKQAAIELEKFGLTEQQKNELRAKAAQDRIDLDQKYSTKEAQMAVAEIPLLRAQADATSLKLEADYQRQVQSLTLQSFAQTIQGQIAAAKEGSVQRRELELLNIDLEQEVAIAALDKRAMSDREYETRVTAIRADAISKRKALSEQDTQNVVTELQAQQQVAELNQQLLLAGLKEGQQARVRASREYYNEVLRAEVDNYSAGLAATKEGSTQRLAVERQHAINLKNIERDSSQAQLDVIVSKYEKISSIVTQSISTISTLENAASQARLNQIDAEINKQTTSAARKAVLEKQKTRIEQQAAEERKRIAKAEAVVNLAASVMQILKSPTAPFVEPAASVVRGIEIAAATATAYAQFRAIDSQKFAQGGIAYGPSHAQGGIQLTRGGRAVGIEIEGGEPVLTAAVSRNPVLLGMASMINQLAGGRALYRDPTPASTWARWAEGGVVSSSAMYLPQVRTGGAVQSSAPAIDYDRFTDMMAAKLGPAFVAGAQALPAQEVNLTELRQRNTQLDKREAETNI